MTRKRGGKSLGQRGGVVKLGESYGIIGEAMDEFMGAIELSDMGKKTIHKALHMARVIEMHTFNPSTSAAERKRRGGWSEPWKGNPNIAVPPCVSRDEWADLAGWSTNTWDTMFRHMAEHGWITILRPSHGNGKGFGGTPCDFTLSLYVPQEATTTPDDDEDSTDNGKDFGPTLDW